MQFNSPYCESILRLAIKCKKQLHILTEIEASVPGFVILKLQPKEY